MRYHLYTLWYTIIVFKKRFRKKSRPEKKSRLNAHKMTKNGKQREPARSSRFTSLKNNLIQKEEIIFKKMKKHEPLYMHHASVQ